jgi:hypothetical protein
MTSYRPLLSWAHVALGLFALIPLMIITAVFGGVWAVVAAATASAQVSAIVGASLGVVLLVVFLSTALASAFSIAAGVLGLRGSPWGDVLLLIASVLHLLNFPLGTALGAFGLWVLLVREPRARMAAPQVELATVR